MRAIPLLLTLALLAGPTTAQTVSSIETPLNVKKPCRIVEDDGEVGDYTLVRCPGLGGSRVYTEASVANVKLMIRWRKGEGHIINGYSLGEKLEWRGVKDKGVLKPHAAIVRIIERGHESMQDDGNYKTYNVLSVIRIGQREACQVAAIDKTENPDALTLARTAADTDASKNSIVDATRPESSASPANGRRKRSAMTRLRNSAADYRPPRLDNPFRWSRISVQPF